MIEKASSKIFETLEREIITGELPPGAKLSELSVATRFGVSRTPVREALHELSAAGLVITGPKRGHLVADYSLSEIFEMYEVLSHLEGLCAQLSARRMSDEERRVLEDLHKNMAVLLDAPDWERRYRMDEQFHELIRNGARNEYLAQQTLLLRNKMAPNRRMFMKANADVSSPYAEHGQIVDAIVSRDAENSQKFMTQHSSVRADSFSDFIAILNDEKKAKVA